MTCYFWHQNDGENNGKNCNDDAVHGTQTKNLHLLKSTLERSCYGTLSYPKSALTPDAKDKKVCLRLHIINIVSLLFLR